MKRFATEEFSISEERIRKSKTRRISQELLSSLIAIENRPIREFENPDEGTNRTDFIQPEVHHADENENFDDVYEMEDDFQVRFSESSSKIPYFPEESDRSDNDFGAEDAVDYISAIFLKNNISQSLGKDIFSMASLISMFPSVTIGRINQKLEEWGDHEKRVYSFCQMCHGLLSESQKCHNQKCHRIGIMQSNVSGNKTIITFSLRRQMQHLLDSGVLDVTNRQSDEEPSLSFRLKDTPKYRRRKEEALRKIRYLRIS